MGKSAVRIFLPMVFMIFVFSACKLTGSNPEIVLVNLPANSKHVETDFSDVPRYPAATLVNPQELPPLQAGTGASAGAGWEVAVYQTDDPANKVITYYDEVMPEKGWLGQWSQLDGASIGSFSKDGIQATISIDSGGKSTSIIIDHSLTQ